MATSVPPLDESLSSVRRQAEATGRLLPVLRPAEIISESVDAILTTSARSAKSGSLASRNALYIAFQPKLLHQARKVQPWMLPSSWDRSDLEQEAFVVFTQLVEEWTGEGSFTPFILGHFSWRLRNAVREARNRERLRVARIETATLIEDDSWVAEEARVLLEELAARFPPIEREIILGRVLEGDGFGVIAHRLGISRKTVYRHWIVIVLELRRLFGLPVEFPTAGIPRSRHRGTVGRRQSRV